jgi:hypothetical protein
MQDDGVAPQATMHPRTDPPKQNPAAHNCKNKKRGNVRSSAAVRQGCDESHILLVPRYEAHDQSQRTIHEAMLRGMVMTKEIFKCSMERVTVHHRYIARLLSYELVRVPLALREYGYKLYCEARHSRELRDPSVMDFRDELYAGIVRLGRMERCLNTYSK